MLGVVLGIVLGLFFIVLCTVMGIRLIRFALRRTPEPPVPTAHVANAPLVDSAYAETAKTAKRAGDGLVRLAAFTFGAFVLAAPWLLLAFMYALGGIATA